MYAVVIERIFNAAHAIVMQGERETVHGHSWRVEVTVCGPELDEDGLLVDFHELQQSVDEILAPFQNADLNATAPFDRVNPTAEHIARHIGETLAPSLSGSVRVQRVDVTEAPGCRAIYEP